MRVRAATTHDLPEVMTVLDAGLLESDPAVVDERIEAGDVLVADDGGPVIGAVVLEGREISAIAVTPGRRGAGIGTTLVERAARDRDELVAEFDPRIQAFWSSLGFRIEAVDDGRYRGRRCGVTRR